MNIGTIVIPIFFFFFLFIFKEKVRISLESFVKENMEKGLISFCVPKKKWRYCFSFIFLSLFFFFFLLFFKVGISFCFSKKFCRHPFAFQRKSGISFAFRSGDIFCFSTTQ